VLLIGIALAVVGLALILVSGLADVIGIGANESEFGWRQIVGLVVGFAAIDVGAVLALMARRRPGRKTMSD